MTHLTLEELARYRAAQADEATRARIAAHLVACETCRRSYADAIRIEPAAGGSRFDAEPFIARGLRLSPRLRPWWRQPVVWVGVPATAAIVLAIFLPLQSTFREPSDTTRGSTLVPEQPAGRVESVTEFRWSSPITASRFIVTVRDAAGTVVLTTPSAGTRAVAATPLGEGVYSWTVEAVDASGRTIAVSPPVDFEVRPPR